MTSRQAAVTIKDGKNWALFPYTVAGSKAITQCRTARLRAGWRSVDSNLWHASCSNCSSDVGDSPSSSSAGMSSSLTSPAPASSSLVSSLAPSSGSALDFLASNTNCRKLPRHGALWFQLSCRPGRCCSVRHDDHGHTINALDGEEIRQELMDVMFLGGAQDARCRKVEVKDVALFTCCAVKRESIHCPIQERQQLRQHGLVAELTSLHVPETEVLLHMRIHNLPRKRVPHQNSMETCYGA